MSLGAFSLTSGKLTAATFIERAPFQVAASSVRTFDDAGSSPPRYESLIASWKKAMQAVSRTSTIFTRLVQCRAAANHTVVLQEIGIDIRPDLFRSFDASQVVPEGA